MGDTNIFKTKEVKYIYRNKFTKTPAPWTPTGGLPVGSAFTKRLGGNPLLPKMYGAIRPSRVARDLILK